MPTARYLPGHFPPTILPYHLGGTEVEALTTGLPGGNTTGSGSSTSFRDTVPHGLPLPPPFWVHSGRPGRYLDLFSSIDHSGALPPAVPGLPVRIHSGDVHLIPPFCDLLQPHTNIPFPINLSIGWAASTWAGYHYHCTTDSHYRRITSFLCNTTTVRYRCRCCRGFTVPPHLGLP